MRSKSSILKLVIFPSIKSELGPARLVRYPLTTSSFKTKAVVPGSAANAAKAMELSILAVTKIPTLNRHRLDP